MIILAIDPGVEKLGYSLFEKKVNGNVTFSYITSGLIKTSRKLSQGKRLQEIYKKLAEVIKEQNVNQVVMEQLFYSNNAKTVIAVAQAQGAVELLAAHHDLPLSYLGPLQIKQIITGYGKADKKAVQKMVDLTLHQKIDILDDDQSDAIACGLAYCFLNPALQ